MNKLLYNGLIEISPTGQPLIPEVTLAYKSGRKQGILQHISPPKFSNRLNSPCEISFDVYKELDGIKSVLWEDVKDFKLIYVDHINKWFEISVHTNEANSTTKHVTGKQLQQSELGQLTLNEVEINTEADIARDDYEPSIFYNPNNPNASILHRLLKDKAPHYTIYHVDETLRKIQREFSFSGQSIHDALNSIASEIDCVFIYGESRENYGAIHRTISAYDMMDYCPICGNSSEYGIKIKARNLFHSNICPTCGNSNIIRGYGKNTNIFLNTDNFSKNIAYSTNSGSVKNCFRLTAGDDDMTATVMAINPNRTRYIWHFSDELRADMSNALSSKLKEYDDNYQFINSQREYNIDVSKYNSLVQKYKEFNKDLVELPSVINGYTALTNAEYEAVDFYGYLYNSLLPVADAKENQTLEEALATLTTENLSPIGVNDATKVSQYTVTMAIESYAKVYVNSALFKIKAECESYANQKWVGKITLTSYTDKDEKDSVDVTVLVNDDAINFVKQKAEKLLAEYDSDNIGVVALFKKEDSDFKTALREYSLSHLDMLYRATNDCLSVLIDANFGSKSSEGYSFYNNFYSKYSLIEQEVFVREEEIKILTNEENTGLLDEIDETKNSIASLLDLKAFLGDELWTEFSAFRRDGEYSNSNFVSDGLTNTELIKNAQDFMQKAQTEILKSATLQHTLNVDVVNFLLIGFDDVKISDSIMIIGASSDSITIADNDTGEINTLDVANSMTNGFLEDFALGNWIHIEVDDKVYKLRMIGYDIDYANLTSLNLDFSDVIYGGDIVNDVKSILSKAQSMSTSYSYVQKKADKGLMASDAIEDINSNGLILNNKEIVTDAKNQNIVMDSSGILLRRKDEFVDDYDDKQAKIVNNGIYFTEDGWESVQTALGEFKYYNPESKQIEDAYGLIANTIVGNLILGENLGIYTENGSIKMDENGVIITTNDGGKSFAIQKDNEDGTIDKLLYVDDDGNLVMSGDVVKVDKKSMREWLIDNAYTFNLNTSNDNIVINDGDYSNAQFTVSSTYGSYNATDDTVFEITTSDGVIGEYNENSHTYYISKATTKTSTITVVAKLNNSDFVQEKTITINKIQGGSLPVQVELESSTGNIFKNKNIQSVLTCRVFQGETDMTEDVTLFRWTKAFENGNIDESWTKETLENYIIISSADIDGKAIIKCEVEY